MAQTQVGVTAFAGGLDQVTSAYQVSPGALRDCINFACRSNGGYYRIPGYERFDGRPAPHNARTLVVAVDVTPGKVLRVNDAGDFGNIEGTVCYVDPFGNYVVLTKLVPDNPPYSLDFVAGPIVIGGDTKGQATSYYTEFTRKQLAQHRAAAANVYRADIQKVPGSGSVLGAFTLDDITYAFRNNAGGTASVLHKSSSAGWVAVALGKTLAFTALSELPAAGGVLTQGGVTAFVRHTIIQSGTVLANDAAGYFVIDTVAGGAFAAGAATFSGGTVTLSGVAVQIALAPNGTYDVSIGSFGSHSGDSQAYGADGVNDGFEFDGTTYVPLVIPDITAKPKYALVHAKHLFFAVGSSLIHSAINDPHNYEVINGAGEIGAGGEVTGMVTMSGSQTASALCVTASDSTSILYGTSSADWNLISLNQGVGSDHRTLQNMFEAFAFDNRGVTQMKQSLNYGNFDAATLTFNIRPLVEFLRGKSVCSALDRENSQYRVYFNNGYGIYVTTSPQGFVGNGVVLFPDIPVCYSNGNLSDGSPMNVFGTADGYVMQNDVGTSFDGKKIDCQLTTNINTEKTPRIRKRYRRAMLELQATSYVEMSVGYSFEWASQKILPSTALASGVFAGLSYWDDMVWDAFYWDGRTNDAVSVELNGTGENLQMSIISSADYVSEFTLSSVVFQFTPRRANR